MKSEMSVSANSSGVTGAMAIQTDKNGNVTYSGTNADQIRALIASLKKEINRIEIAKTGKLNLHSYTGSGVEIINGKSVGAIDPDTRIAELRDQIERYEDYANQVEMHDNGYVHVKNSQPTRSTSTTPQNTNNNISNPISNNSTLKIKDDTLAELIGKINECKDLINDVWNSLKTEDIAKINNSWAANDAKTYVDKLLSEEKKINSLNSALSLLSNTYQKVMNESSATGEEVKTSINKIS